MRATLCLLILEKGTGKLYHLIAKMIEKELGVSEDRLRSGNRLRIIVKGRKIFCQVAVKRLGYSGAMVARYLNITTSAVNRLAF